MPTNFKIDVLPEAKRLALLTKDANSDNYLFPTAMNLPPMSKVAYESLKDTIKNKKAKAKTDFDALKQMLDRDAKASGDPAPKLRFDDVNFSIEIDYGFKECMDRFSDEAKTKIREVLGVTASVKEKPNQDVFREKLATPELKTAYQDRKKDAYGDFRRDGYKEPATDVDVSGAGDAKGALDTIFGSQPGMCMNDNHSNADGKEMLTNNMAALKKANVKTLFIEHFWQEQQGLLDEYMSSADNAPLPKALETAVEKLDNAKDSNGQLLFKGVPHFKNMLAAAKKEKIRIVGLDDFSAKTPQDGDPRNWEHRAARFNQTAAEVVKREKGNGKFLVMAGEKHNNTHEGGIPGLSQLLGVHNFDPKGGKLTKQPEDKKLRGMRSEARQAFFDGFIDQFFKDNPDANDACVYADAEAYSRSQSATIANLTPASAAKLGKTIAARALKQMKEDKTDLATPVDKGKLQAAVEKGGSLLHMVAEVNDLDLIQDLIAAGQSATAVDANGDTPLHKLIYNGNTDPGPGSELLLAAGGSLATKNKANLTPLHNALALKYDLTPPFKGWLDNHQADFKNAVAVPKGDLSVLDIVIARGDAALEDAMYDNNIVADVPRVVLGKDEKKSTPEILAMASCYDSPEAKAKGPELYQKLYDDFPELRSTMDLAAIRAMGNRRNDKALRLCVVNADSASKVTTGGGKAAYDPRNDSIAFGVDLPPQQVMGSLIHEMTHFAANKLYDNDAQPFSKTDTITKKSYQDALGKDALQTHRAFGKKESDVQQTLNGRLLGYYGKPRGAVMVNQEGIVSVPQILVEHGRDVLERRGGSTLDFWDKTFRDKCDKTVASDPRAARLSKTKAVGAPYQADVPWMEKSTFDAAKIAEVAFTDARVQADNLRDNTASTGLPTITTKNHNHPREFRLNPIGELDDGDVAGLRTRIEAFVKTCATYKEPSEYGQIGLKAQAILNLPPNTPHAIISQKAREVNTDASNADKKYAPFRKAISAAEAAAKTAIEKAIKSLPDNIHSGVVGKLIDAVSVEVQTVMSDYAKRFDRGELKADTVLDLSGFDKAVSKQVSEFVSTAKIAAGRKDDVDDRAKKKAFYRHLRDNNQPLSPEEFAESVVMEAETRFYKANPPANGLPMEVDSGKQKELMKKIAEMIRKKGNPAPGDFEKFVGFVETEVLHKKGAKKIGKRDQSHVSIASRKEWVKKLGKM